MAITRKKRIEMQPEDPNIRSGWEAIGRRVGKTANGARQAYLKGHLPFVFFVGGVPTATLTGIGRYYGALEDEALSKVGAQTQPAPQPSAAE